ncbi:MAG: hypothetical protein ACPL7D_01485 [Candidatus Sumerlaeaceae bacterium]
MKNEISRRVWLISLTALLVATVVAGAFADTTHTLAKISTTKPKIECPANYQKGSPACKRAKAEHKCPEQLGGKCLAKK